MNQITRIYVRRYRDNGQTTAYVDWADGSRTEGTLKPFDCGHGQIVLTFGPHMHALFSHARRQGLHLTRETW